MTKCLAPWTHTYCSPQGERRMCCASREPSTNFKQYIDSNEGLEGLSKEEAMKKLKDQQEFYIPTLEEHWNSEHMKRIRREMMDGKLPKECEVCEKKLLNTSVYRDYFENLFGHKREDLEANTDKDGTFMGMPISFDYRFSNLCNFKCRMCGPMLSSSWETEQKKHNPTIADFEPWMKHKDMIEFNQATMRHEMQRAIVDSTVEEIYWVGGEPLMMKEHWEIMAMLIRINKEENVYVRYNTNLSEIYNKTGGGVSKNVHLFQLLHGFRDWQICASIDGTGIIGEYIRTGLDYKKFLENFEVGVAHQWKPGQMRLDFTMTTPGLFEVRNMFNLSKQFKVPLLTKVCFEFSSDIAMCPLFLPKDVLHPIVQELIDELEPQADKNQQALIDVLKNLLTRDTMEDKYEDYLEGRVKGKARIEELESRRLAPITMAEIFAQNSEAALDFWNGIE